MAGRPSTRVVGAAAGRPPVAAAVGWAADRPDRRRQAAAEDDRLRLVHEVSLVSGLLERIEAEARARRALRVHRVRIKVGELSGVETDLLRSAYDLLRERSVCAEAELEIDREPARWRCPRCGAEPEPGMALRCPRCELPVGLVSGGEIVLEQIEMEVP